MIDLKQMEAEIDELLEKETTDSLLTWLYEKRISDMRKRLGQGVFESLSRFNIENKKVRPVSGCNLKPKQFKVSFINVGAPTPACYVEAA